MIFPRAGAPACSNFVAIVDEDPLVATSSFEAIPVDNSGIKLKEEAWPTLFHYRMALIISRPLSS